MAKKNNLDEIYNNLKDPFHVDAVHWRVGATNKAKTKGIALAYIDARDVMLRLDKVVGFENWQDEYIETPSGRLICRLSLRIGNEWVTKSDGAGETQVEGDKGAISDAFKRAAVKWGCGRYLYKLPNVWVDIDEYRKIKTPPPIPSWAKPKYC